MLLREFVDTVRLKLGDVYPAEEAKVISGILCREFFNVESYTYIISPEMALKRKPLAKAEAALERLVSGEPLQYVLGFADFYGRRFNVNPTVLIPRPETEILCREAIESALQIYRIRSAYGQAAAPVRILDLCTGSGCIAWTLSLGVPDSVVVAVDISADALATAAAQPFDHSCSPLFVQADIFDESALEKAFGKEKFDIILSNPPYILNSEKPAMRKNVLDFEPSIALFVENDGDAMAFNRRIAEISKKFSNTGSVGYVEINEALGEASCNVFKKSGFENVTVIRDISGKNRFVKYSGR